MSFLKQEGDHALLYIKVAPNSSSTKIVGKIFDEKNQEYLKIILTAAPEDGKANAELIKFLSKILKIPKSKFEIIRGDISRIKVLKIVERDTHLTIQKISEAISLNPHY